MWGKHGKLKNMWGKIFGALECQEANLRSYLETRDLSKSILWSNSMYGFDQNT